jgi:hypothetical protein
MVRCAQLAMTGRLRPKREPAGPPVTVRRLLPER